MRTQLDRRQDQSNQNRDHGHEDPKKNGQNHPRNNSAFGLVFARNLLVHNVHGGLANNLGHIGNCTLDGLDARAVLVENNRPEWFDTTTSTGSGTRARFGPRVPAGGSGSSEVRRPRL